MSLSPCVHSQGLWKAAGGSSEGWNLDLGTSSLGTGGCEDKAEPALGREGGRADVTPGAVPQDPAPRGRWKRERNPVCGVLLAGHFSLAFVSAPLFD